MFCPTCGRENSREKKFCATCGTNLEIVTQALDGTKDDFFTKTEAAFDNLIARYSEHIFKDAARLNIRKVSTSWKLLGQGVVTSFVDMILLSLMWNILPLRFLILLISTPIRLLSHRGNRQTTATSELEEQRALSLAEPASNRQLPEPVPVITEHTTRHLEEQNRQQQRRVTTRE